MLKESILFLLTHPEMCKSFSVPLCKCPFKYRMQKNVFPDSVSNKDDQTN